jgi:hypothetical protein
VPAPGAPRSIFYARPTVRRGGCGSPDGKYNAAVNAGYCVQFINAALAASNAGDTSLAEADASYAQRFAAKSAQYADDEYIETGGKNTNAYNAYLDESEAAVYAEDVAAGK